MVYPCLLLLPTMLLGARSMEDTCVNNDSTPTGETLIEDETELSDMHLLQMIARQGAVAEFTVANGDKDVTLDNLEKLLDNPKELEKALSEDIQTLTNNMVKDAPARLTLMLDGANETQHDSLASMYRDRQRHRRVMCTELDEESFPPLPLRHRQDQRACARAGLADLSEFRHVVNMEVENEFLPVFASVPLSEKNEQIDRVVIVHHGVRSNANRYFCDMVRGAPSNTLVIAPWLSNKRITAQTWAGDKANNSTAKSVCWNSRFFEWMNGGNTAHSETTSFAVMDTLVKTLQQSRTNFPNLKRIFVSGFSAGCQMVTRWAVYTPVTVPNQNSGLPVTTVVGGCGTYLYLDDSRPALSCSHLANSGDDHVCSDFLQPKNCPTYNTYRYGLKKGIDSHHHHSFDHNKYLTSFGEYFSTMRHVQANFKHKDVRFIFGRHDVCNCKMDGYKNDDVCFRRDGSCKGHALGVYCEELLQGTNRLQRGLNYMSALKQFYSSRNESYEPRFSLYEGGHSDSRFYKSDAFQEWVFGSM